MDLTIPILFISLFVFLILGVPVAFSIMMSVIAAAAYAHLDLVMVAERMFATFEKFSLTAIVLFMLMGIILSKTGATKKLVDFIESVVGGITGGLSITLVWSCAGFGTLTGSTTGTVAAIGTVMIPEMEERGYDRPFSAALTASAGTLGHLIPPSIAAIVYGVALDVSIGRLFIALIIPAIILGIAFSLTCYFVSRRRGLGRRGQKYAPGERLHLLLGAAPALVIPLAVIGGIYGGIVTPTEAGAVGVVAAAALGGTVYRSKEKSFLVAIKESLLEASILAAIIMLIISVCSAFAYLFSAKQMPQAIASALFGISENPIVILLLFNLIMIILGMFLDTLGLIIMMAPVIKALFIPLDINLLYVGVLMVMNASVGQISPPVGGNLYVACGVAGVSLEKISKQVIPFILVIMAVLVLLIVFPQIVAIL